MQDNETSYIVRELTATTNASVDIDLLKNGITKWHTGMDTLKRRIAPGAFHNSGHNLCRPKCVTDWSSVHRLMV